MPGRASFRANRQTACLCRRGSSFSFTATVRPAEAAGSSSSVTATVRPAEAAGSSSSGWPRRRLRYLRAPDEGSGPNNAPFWLGTASTAAAWRSSGGA